MSTRTAFEANRYRSYSPNDLIAIGLSHPPDFAPGASWKYSNTGYIVAGEVIRAVTGNTWDVEVANRIIVPLGLTRTVAPGDDPTISRAHAHGYHVFTTRASNREYTDTTEHNMTWGGAAGALSTTARDANRFMSALLSGQLLRPAELAQLKTPVTLGRGIGYGLGIVWQQLSCSSAGVWWHDGGTVGYLTWTGTTPDASLSLTLTLSTNTFFDKTLGSTSNNLSDTLIRHVFCGAQSSGDDRLQRRRSDLFGPRASLN